MLDRLVGRTVFSVAHGIVRKYKQSGQLHERRKPDRRSRVVAEDEEGRAKRAQFGQREAVHNGRHRVLADTEMQVLTVGAVRLEVSGSGERQSGLVRWPEIRRAAEEPRDVLGKHIQYLSRRVPPSDSLCIGRKNREIMVPPGWQFPPLH